VQGPGDKTCFSSSNCFSGFKAFKTELKAMPPHLNPLPLKGRGGQIKTKGFMMDFGFKCLQRVERIERFEPLELL
jgi:hypothetical protein